MPAYSDGDDEKVERDSMGRFGRFIDRFRTSSTTGTHDGGRTARPGARQPSSAVRPQPPKPQVGDVRPGTPSSRPRSAAPTNNGNGRSAGNGHRGGNGNGNGNGHGDGNGRRVEPDTDLADVTIVYSPVLDGDPDPGEVVWTWVPFEEDPTQGKDRPVVIIGRSGSRLAAVQLTTKPHPERDDEVPVGSGSWDSSGRTSYAKLERILTVDPQTVRREGAVLDRRRFDDVVAALRTFHGIRLA